MFINVSKFLKELSEINSKFDWYYAEKTYKGGTLITKEVRGVKRGGDATKEYIPLTAVVESLTGKFFEMDRFDLAATEIGMSPDSAMQIVDACDDWPDRLHGYFPKLYESKLREDIIKICME